MDQGRFKTNAGAWIVPRFYSEFEAIWLVLTGQESAFRSECEIARSARCNGLRIFGAWATQPVIKFDRRTPNYEAALRQVLTIAAEYGLYVEVAFFCDAQMIVPDAGERREWWQWFLGLAGEYENCIPQTANEPFKNGWSEANDPALLELGCLAVGGPGTFSVGDPCDVVEDEHTAEPLLSVWSDVARTVGPSSYLVLHPERKGQDERYAGWVDHLKGADDVLDRMADGLGWRGAYLVDEPMGAASTYQNGRRDNRPVAHVAGAVIGAMLGGYTYMHRSDEDPAIPGLMESAVAADIILTPEWRFQNATLGDSPVASFTGFTNGKVRTVCSGSEAWACAWGNGGTLTWRSGWTPELRYSLADGQGNRVEVWYAS